MRRLILLSALAATPAPALAVPITIDVTGAVTVYHVYENSPGPADMTGTLSDLSAYGTVTFDSSIGPAPTIEDLTYLQQSLGTPLAEFVSASLTWAGGTFLPAPLAVPADATSSGDLLRLFNGTANTGGLDTLMLADEYIWVNPSDGSAEASSLRFFFDDAFIADEGPPTGTEFPNLATASGRFGISSVRAFRDDDDILRSNGYLVVFDLTSASLRPVSVPEPGTLSLLLAGATIFAVGRRKRRTKTRTAPTMPA